MKAKLFSHLDRDGVVCNLLGSKYFILKGYSVSADRCDYNNIDAKIQEYLNSYEYDKDAAIFITDVSMSYEMAQKLDSLPNPKVMIDHHGTALESLGKNNGGKTPDFNWMYIKEGDSASMLLFKYLIAKSGKDSQIDIQNKLQQYYPLVYNTDLWDSKDRLSEEFMRNKDLIDDLNGLMTALGYVEFRDRFIYNPSIELNEVERAKVDVVKRLKKNTCKGTVVYSLTYKLEGRSILFGLCFCGMYKSDVAEYQFTMNSDLAFLFLLDLNSCNGSLRSNPRHDIGKTLDMSKIAGQMSIDSGGHFNAAGFGYEIKDYDKIINKILLRDFTIQ